MTPFVPRTPFVRGDKKKVTRLQSEAIEAEIKAENLEKRYDYYCPACLFQTNEFTVICPKYGHEGLKESGKDRFRKVD